MLRLSDRYVLLGSCFSQYMGEKMALEGYPVVCNPLGTLFNPESIRLTVTHALEGRREDLPVFFDESMREWRCWWANTRFSATSYEGVAGAVQATFESLGEELRRAQHLFLTLGTNVCYRLREDGMVVTNCQRQPDVLFSEYTLSLSEVQHSLQLTLETLWRANPNLRVTFTISPYRYRKYGWHRSQLSKAVLLLAVDYIQQQTSSAGTGRVDYFPSYEIMMDELRDFGYYASDGLHPSRGAIDIIWKRLCESQP